MLVSIDLDESTEDQVVAVYDVAGALVRIKSKPSVARGKGEEDDGGDGDEAAAAARTEQPQVLEGPTQAKYANVGLVLWQAGLVAADWIIRHCQARAEPRNERLKGLSVLELGCGVGQCGIALAAAGAGPVIMTDLSHIVPLAAENARLNAGVTPIEPKAVPYVWGEDAGPVLAALRQQGDGEDDAHERWPDLLVAADCLYEPRVYPLLLSAIEQLSGPRTRVVLCHRLRVYDEQGFERAAVEGGFEVRAAPREELHADYACGGWRLVELRRRDGGGRGGDGDGGGGSGGAAAGGGDAAAG